MTSDSTQTQWRKVGPKKECDVYFDGDTVHTEEGQERQSRCRFTIMIIAPTFRSKENGKYFDASVRHTDRGGGYDGNIGNMGAADQQGEPMFAQ